MAANKTVPNQRILTINKQPTDKQHKFTANNLAALDEAARRLQSKGGFKLYMYLAKNQDKYNFALSSADFCAWSGLGIAAYRTAFEELEKEGYLIKATDKQTIYTFYDKAQIEDNKSIDDVIIEIPRERVIETKEMQKQFSF